MTFRLWLAGFMWRLIMGFPDRQIVTIERMPKIDSLDLTKVDFEGGKSYQQALPEGIVPKDKEVQFAVTSNPRHVPWSIRKKELEQEARQKRRQLESFREPQ